MSTQTQYFVQGMKCDGCIANANTALAQVTGFEKADFDLNQGTATIEGDVDPQAVCQALTQAGYPAVVKST
ncbi:heavy-metal-associated domain-containing protein [Kaarinaea lacus]